MTNASPLRVAVKNRVMTLTLNRPDVGDAINVEMAKALMEASIQADHNDEIRCVVLTGAGRFFSVGGDVSALPRILISFPHSCPS